MYLLSTDNNNFEQFLVDTLIGSDNKYGQNELNYGLINNKDRFKLIKNDFYKEALLIANSLNLILKQEI